MEYKAYYKQQKAAWELGMRLPQIHTMFVHYTVESTVIPASFPGSSAPEQEIELIHAERAWYIFSREKPSKVERGEERP